MRISGLQDSEKIGEGEQKYAAPWGSVSVYLETAQIGPTWFKKKRIQMGVGTKTWRESQHWALAKWFVGL